MLTFSDLDPSALISLLRRYGLEVKWVEDDGMIPGSYWGGCEAGLIGTHLYVRRDTPIHSAVHESCHFVCMDANRRAQLHTDAGGDYDEENAVNYLQILLADFVQGCDQLRMMADMDAWGYSFRLGSARAWFEQDAEDARLWLLRHGLINSLYQVTWRLRA